MVAGEVGLTFDSVDDEYFGLSSWGRGELDVRGEGCAPEPNNTCSTDTVDDFLGGEGAVLDEGLGAVNPFFPFLFFALGYGDDDGGALVAASVKEAVNLRDLACDRGVDVGRDEARGLSNDGAYLDEVTLLYGRGGWGTDVLTDGDDDLTGQRELLDGSLS